MGPLTQQALARADEWMRHVVDIFTKLRLEVGEKEGIAVAYYHLCFEHHSAIAALIRVDNPSSAFALCRPQFDAYLRAMWVHKIADASAIENLMNGGDPAGAKTIMERLPDDQESKALLALWATSWKHLCDFTHGGALQLKARLRDGTIKPAHFEDHQIEALLNASARLVYLSILAISDLVQFQDLMEETNARFFSVYRHPGVR